MTQHLFHAQRRFFVCPSPLLLSFKFPQLRGTSFSRLWSAYVGHKTLVIILSLVAVILTPFFMLIRPQVFSPFFFVQNHTPLITTHRSIAFLNRPVASHVDLADWLIDRWHSETQPRRIIVYDLVRQPACLHHSIQYHARPGDNG